MSEPAAMLSALEKLPAFKGVVFRGCPEDAHFTRDNQVTVTLGPISTSRRPDLVAGAGTVYAIYTSTGREITAFSAQKDEYEVVLLPGTTLAIASTRRLGDLDVRLVFEITPGQQVAPETVETMATTVASWLADVRPAAEVRPRFVGDIA